MRGWAIHFDQLLPQFRRNGDEPFPHLEPQFGAHRGEFACHLAVHSRNIIARLCSQLQNLRVDPRHTADEIGDLRG